MSQYDSIMDSGNVVAKGMFALADDFANGEPASGYQTVDTVPHIDHYRNKDSATGRLRARPTLSDLHDFKVNGLRT